MSSMQSLSAYMLIGLHFLNMNLAEMNVFTKSPFKEWTCLLAPHCRCLHIKRALVPRSWARSEMNGWTSGRFCCFIVFSHDTACIVVISGHKARRQTEWHRCKDQIPMKPMPIRLPCHIIRWTYYASYKSERVNPSSSFSQPLLAAPKSIISSEEICLPQIFLLLNISHISAKHWPYTICMKLVSQ